MIRYDPTRRSFSLIEIVVSLSILALMIFPLLFLQLRSRESAGQTREKRLARMAAETVIERMRAQAAFSQNEFGDLAADWSTAGTFRVGSGQTFTPANAFFVDGLPSVDGDPLTPHGQIAVILDETVHGLDLDADGDATETLAATDRYRVLPVRVRVSWGRGGQSSYEVEAFISQRNNFRRDNES